MRIAVSTFHLAVLSIFAFIGLISSEVRTLKDLFPGYNGIMPPLETSWAPQPHFRNFDEYWEFPLLYELESYVKRDHIVFGYELNGLIHDPGTLFRVENSSIAFDTQKDEWIALPIHLSHQLGVGRHIELLQARDEVAATLVSTSSNLVQRRAHSISCKEANDRADIVEAEQLELLREHRTTVRDIAMRIKEEYSQTYNRAFTLHLNQDEGPSRHEKRERRH